MAHNDGEAIEAILFDLGGVVFDIDFPRAFAHWARSAGCDPGELRARFCHDDDTGLRYETGRLDDGVFLQRLRTALGVDLSDAQLLAGWNAIIGGAMPGIAEALAKAAARWPLYAFSNTNRAHKAYFSTRFATLLRHFRHVFTSCDIGLRKPDVAAFRFVAGAIGVPSPRILFFDDLTANVAGARACGMRAVRVTTPATVTDTLAALPR